MFLSFQDARNKVWIQNFESQKEFYNWIKGKSKLVKIPTNPSIFYKDEWVSWNDWLKTDTIPFQNRTYYDYEGCKKIVSEFEFKNRQEF